MQMKQRRMMKQDATDGDWLYIGKDGLVHLVSQAEGSVGRIFQITCDVKHGDVIELQEQGMSLEFSRTIPRFADKDEDMVHPFYAPII